MRSWLALLAAFAGCVADAPTQTPPCSQGGECPTGQRCVSDHCVTTLPGDLQFSAELFAPETRPMMLPRAEIPSLTIDNGQVNVMFPKSIKVDGRVLLHATDATSAAAKVVFHRKSRIVGVPDYEVSVDSMPGKGAGEAAFSVRLVPNNPSETYDITIYPDDGTLFAVEKGQSPPNQLAPPVTITGQSLQSDTTMSLTCDSAGLRELTGVIVDAVDAPMPGMFVRAYTEPPDPPAPPVRAQLVSSTGLTAEDGRFTIYIPKNRTDYFDLKVTPGPGVLAPTLTRRRPDVTVGTGSTGTSTVPPTSPIELAVIHYPDYPSFFDYALPVAYGNNQPAIGARVLFDTTLMISDDLRVDYEAQAIVDPDGLARAKLLPGSGTNRMYKVSVLPPQGATYASAWDLPLDIGPAPSASGNAVLQAVSLGGRVSVTGRVLDSRSMPATNVTVRPQLGTTFALTNDQADRLAALSLFEATTGKDGTFAIFLDAKLLGMPAIYDVELVPPQGSVLPRWSEDNLAVPADRTLLDTGAVTLPAAVLGAGKVTDENNQAVPNAEVRVYSRRATETTAKLRSLAKSDNNGNVTLVLPSLSE